MTGRPQTMSGRPAVSARLAASARLLRLVPWLTLAGIRSLKVWVTAFSVVLVLIATLHQLGGIRLPVLDLVDRQLQDQRARLTTALPSDEVLIVDIDEASLAAIGRWTWPRRTLADLVHRVADEGQARVLAFDILFAEPLPGEDAVLAAAIRDRPVVLGYYFSSDEGGRRSGQLPAPTLAADGLPGLGLQVLAWDGYGANLAELAEAATGHGFFNAQVDEDGVVRAVPLLAAFGPDLYESLVISTLRLATGAGTVRLSPEAVHVGPHLRLPIEANLTARVPFATATGPSAGRIRYLSAVDVLQGRVDPSVFRDRIVLVGASAQGIGDRRATPVSRSTPGVEVHATLIAGALAGELVSQPPRAALAMALATLVFGLLAAFWMPRLSASGILLLLGTLLIVVFAGAATAYGRHGWILPVAAPLCTLLAIGMLNLAVGHFIEGRARRAVIELFGQYVSPELVRRMARRPQDYPIESQNKRLTILFADVRGFTRIAESMEPQALREYLNRFLTRMTEVVHRHGGTVDKYMGDAIMAFWGAPIDDPRQEDHAVAAALEMQRAVLVLNDEFERRGWPLLAIGVGINSGTARVGDMGSQLRRTYTAIGDAVNLAARLEALTKRYNLPVLIGEATAQRVHRVPLTALGESDVQGRTEKVRVFCPSVFVRLGATMGSTEPASRRGEVGAAVARSEVARSEAAGSGAAESGATGSALAGSALAGSGFAGAELGADDVTGEAELIEALDALDAVGDEDLPRAEAALALTASDAAEDRP